MRPNKKKESSFDDIEDGEDFNNGEVPPLATLAPSSWSSLSIVELRRIFAYLFHLQAKVRHQITRAEQAEGKDSFPLRVPSYQDIHTCSLLITDKPGHGPAIAVAVSESEKGWHVWQKDVKTPEGGKQLMQFAYIKQHMPDEYPVLIRMTSGKEQVELATKKDDERLDALREKYELGPIAPRPW